MQARLTSATENCIFTAQLNTQRSEQDLGRDQNRSGLQKDIVADIKATAPPPRWGCTVADDV